PFVLRHIAGHPHLPTINRANERCFSAPRLLFLVATHHSLKSPLYSCVSIPLSALLEDDPGKSRQMACRKKCPRKPEGTQLPARSSDLVMWHATHGLVPGAGVVSGVCANCQIEKTILRIKATKTATSRTPRPFSCDRTTRL